ncbi:thiol-disulfide isomerase [Leptospira perolatii]|uniref:Thiol-disulfide isomerase n=1 Tax=Leptospira perolatii TaxID=2023191 RepID=A0A2M9ZMN2_9LEPT|nr:TlpA disulfide reductase family protein [Leptospira perolatii]PJZ70151.1 thiol-disulfide isomerase [Leptospira perolatii]PJZ73340.1 thiol-disulfide isomerase [Leptospira perolatii]
MKPNRHFFPFAFAAVLLVFVLFNLLFCKGEEDPEIYQITLVDWDGKETQLSDFKGKVIVLDFWASWCVPCKKAVPVVDALQKELEGKNAVVLGVNTENNLSVAQIRKAAEEFGMKYPSLLDPDWKLVNQLRLEGQPALFVFSKSGKRIHFQYGISQKDFPMLRGRLRNWLDSP